MPKPYKIWIKNAAGFITADANGEVTLSGSVDSLPASLATPSAPNGWTLVEVLGLSPDYEVKGETYESPSGREYSDFRAFRKMTAVTRRYAFPSEFATWDAIGKLCSGGNSLVVVVDTYDVTLHTAGKGIAVVAKATPEHDYTDGTKRWTLELRKRVEEA